MVHCKCHVLNWFSQYASIVSLFWVLFCQTLAALANLWLQLTNEDSSKMNAGSCISLSYWVRRKGNNESIRGNSTCSSARQTTSLLTIMFKCWKNMASVCCAVHNVRETDMTHLNSINKILSEALVCRICWFHGGNMLTMADFKNASMVSLNAEMGRDAQ